MQYHLLFLFCLVAQCLAAQEKVSYQISFDNAAHHEARITVTFPGLPAAPLRVHMSRSSPGRYALHEFAKHVYNLAATDGQGKALAVTRPDPYSWLVTGHNGAVNMSYTLFGNHADGTYTGINELYAHLNMPATFLWAEGLENRPHEVTFNLPAGKNWNVATQLKPETGTTYSAPHLQYFMDSPTHVGNNLLREWTVSDKGKTKTIQLALHHNGTNAEAEAYAERVKAVVQEQQAVFGELPDFDFGRYTFLATYLPWVDGDGMEHRNSTVLTGTSSLRNDAAGLLGTVSHEFFHAWNVERIRPKTLEPFDFLRANMSGELWFAEGFTNYYGALALVRTGDNSVADYAKRLTFVTNFLLNSPGRRYFSAVEMSQQAPFVDAAVAVEPNNRANTYISYYFFGEAIALALDLSLRQQFKNGSLDAYMRRVWEKYGKPEKPYTIDDLRVTLGEVTGNPAFADNFFGQYILGKEAAPYESLLAPAGFQLQKANPGKASLVQSKITYTDKGGVLDSPVLVTSPLYAAGLEQGDVLLTINGQRATERSVLAALTNRKPGEELEIEFEQHNNSKTATVTLAEDPTLSVVPFEEAGKPVTKAIRDFRQSWLKK